MAYSWFRVDAAMTDHPKTFALEAALGDQNAGWYVIRLMSWAQRYAPSGRFKYALGPQVEAALRWRGEQNKLISTLQNIGFIDDTNEGEFEVHDWPEYQGFFVEKSRKDAKRKRNKRNKRRTAATEPGAQPAVSAAPPTRRDGRDETNETDTAGAAALVALWNEVRPGECAKVRKLSGKALIAARARLRETPDLDRWKAGIARTHRSSFLRGSKGWRLTLRWLVKPDSLERIESGEFDDQGAASSPTQPEPACVLWK